MTYSTPRFEAATSEVGHVKVRLRFKTWEPKHIRSHFLKTEASAAPPFIEEVSVLVPVEHAYNRLSAYSSIFATLTFTGVLAKSDTLTAFEICEEDDYTLAFIERESR